MFVRMPKPRALPHRYSRRPLRPGSSRSSLGPLLVHGPVEIGEHVCGAKLQDRPRVVSSVRSAWSSSPYHTSTRRHGPRRDRVVR